MASPKLPELPVAHDELASYIAKHPSKPMGEIMEPFRQYEAQLREMYAQDRGNHILDDPYVNVLPLFTKDTQDIKARSRNLETETSTEKDRYIMALPDDKRRANGSPAVVESLKEFRYNFSVFSESSLADMDWSNVVAAGSSVVNCLLPVPEEYKKSKRALRQHYHEKFCPASDVDLFLYGLDEKQAIEKIKQIETRVRDALLSETTVVRTKNAITICSQYPTRHVQIVLRVYKSVSEILTGFDIDCSGAAYDGQQVYCTPRALASYITQINHIDLSRRSPSYENRLSKYSHRNFEVSWPDLDRSRIDPTIFERSFSRTLGLARLLVLERLPTTNAREQYLRKRREERGRPVPNFNYQHRLRGNIKDHHEDEIAEWVDEEEVSNYHTFTVPYGPRFHAKKIEKLCYTRDLLLNAEWNQPKEREVYLHRHPAFFGRVEDVIGDCCGTCPEPVTPEEIETAEKESEIYVSGNVTFRIDDPGRQQIGSFNPLTDDDWTEMAYVGNTARLCQAIVDEDLEHVEDWLSQEGADPNKRDYTGRTALHLAVSNSTPEIVKCLVDHGARLVARLADGRTALHLAAARGSVEITRILLEKSAENEEAEEEKKDQRRKSREDSQKAGKNQDDDADGNGSDVEMVDDDESEDGVQSMATGSFVKVPKPEEKSANDDGLPDDDAEDDPDFYDIDVVSWDSHCSALHYAILGGHTEVVKLLVQEFAADVLSPIKFGDGSWNDPRTAILTLVLGLALPLDKAVSMTETLLGLGATCAQADANGVTAFHRYVQLGPPKLLDTLWAHDQTRLMSAINHIAVGGNQWSPSATSPLMTAIARGDPILALRLLEAGSNPNIDFDSWLKGAQVSFENSLSNFGSNMANFKKSTEQPIIVAIQCAQAGIVLRLLEMGADPNALTKESHDLIDNEWARRYQKGAAALDVARSALKQLRGYEGEKFYFDQRFVINHVNMRQQSYLDPPPAPQGTEEFLQQFEVGTYQHWVVSTDIEINMGVYKARVKDFIQKKEAINARGLVAKQEHIQDLIFKFEQIEKALLAKGAQTFSEQYSYIKDPPQDVPTPTADSGGRYQYDFTFQRVKDVTETRKIAYIELFEAAWQGDLEKIKSLTLSVWGTDHQESPLQVAVADKEGNTPFSLAFLQGHYDVAKGILEICQAQWAPRDDQQARYKMSSDEPYSDDGRSVPESEDEEPGIYKEIVDERFTIENIGQVSMQVKCSTVPTDLMSWAVPTFIMRNGIVQPNMRQNLLQFAINEDDHARFKFFIDMDIHFTNRKPELVDEAESSHFYAFPEPQFREAIKLGRIDLLADVIQRTGAGIPLEHLVKKTGVEMKVKPRYYQGLTVYGKKRSDWANAGRNLVVKATGSKVPPLLTAAVEGSLKSVEWFLSDTPQRLYSEFGKSKVAKEDSRLKHLSQSPGGFDRAITKWLGIQNDFVIHCAVLGPYNGETSNLIRYLLKVCPSSLEAKSERGYTPFFLACLMGRVEFAKILIDAGADQAVKDNDGNNIVHAALINTPDVKELRRLFDLFDTDLRPELFVQRNRLDSGGDTPLHFWLKKLWMNSFNQTADATEFSVMVTRTILKYSDGRELEALNGSGDTCLHTVVMRQLLEEMKVLLDQNPKLLYRENSVGRTPAEMAYDCFIKRHTSKLEDIAVQPQNAAEAVTRTPESFLDPPENEKAQLPDLIWELAREYMDKFPNKRRLVSLNEANDVARRLGENYTWQRYQFKPNAPLYDIDGQGGQNEINEQESDFVTVQYSAKAYSAWKVDQGKFQA